MNTNAFEVFIYMIIHLLLLFFKNFISNWLNKIFNINNNKKKKNKIELLKQKLNSLNEQIREISSVNEYVKYAKMERQINNIKEEIIKLQNSEPNIKDPSMENNFYNKIKIFYHSNNILTFLPYLIEFFFFRNKYLEVDYESNENNIVANYYYNENDNEYYALIPVNIILLCETMVFNSIYNLIVKFFNS